MSFWFVTGGQWLPGSGFRFKPKFANWPLWLPYLLPNIKVCKFQLVARWIINGGLFISWMMSNWWIRSTGPLIGLQLRKEYVPRLFSTWALGWILNLLFRSFSLLDFKRDLATRFTRQNAVPHFCFVLPALCWRVFADNLSWIVGYYLMQSKQADQPGWINKPTSNASKLSH